MHTLLARAIDSVSVVQTKLVSDLACDLACDRCLRKSMRHLYSIFFVRHWRTKKIEYNCGID
ncbi:hypothetical protein C7B80_06005 [Cyanosarcina cf. burmensis CCALA 770]|nr:hypothetical protein C7B80_06005 [Cyanosarcina cf. burmensis CCALA 770]